jgi:hypothetical protein
MQEGGSASAKKAGESRTRDAEGKSSGGSSPSDTESGEDEFTLEEDPEDR